MILLLYKYKVKEKIMPTQVTPNMLKQFTPKRQGLSRIPKNIVRNLAKPVRGVVTGGVGGGVVGAVGTISSIAKGIGNVFGRKTPDNTLVQKAISITLPLREGMKYKDILSKIKKGTELTGEERTKISDALKKNNRLEKVAKKLGAKESDMIDAKAFIHNFLNI